MIITKQVLNLKPHRNFSQEKKGDIFDKSQKNQQQKKSATKEFQKSLYANSSVPGFCNHV